MIKIDPESILRQLEKELDESNGHEHDFKGVV